MADAGAKTGMEANPMEAIKTGTAAIEPKTRATTPSRRGMGALVAAVCTATVIAAVLVSNIGPRAQASPNEADTSYDRIEFMRGAHVTPAGPADTSYDRIEFMRGLSRD
jgi:hypothetical protein